MKAIVAIIAVLLVGGVVWYAMKSAPPATTITTNNYDTSVSPTAAVMEYVSPMPTMATTGTMTTSTSPTVTGTSAKTMAVNLGELNSSGQTGTATLSEANGKVTVKVVITGAPVGSDEPAHIHVGKCPEVGAVKYPLNNVKNGLSTTTINASMAQLQSELPLGLNVHKSATEMTVYTACGDLGM